MVYLMSLDSDAVASYDHPMEQSAATDAASFQPVVQMASRGLRDELIGFRRQLHSNPELSFHEFNTTRLVQARLESEGLQPWTLPDGTGLVCDIGDAGVDVPRTALRADLDALPLTDGKDVSYRSQNSGVCHACGHDVHTTIVLGAGLVLAELNRANTLPRPVRLIFQPAEESLSGGATDVIAAGAMSGVGRIFALHCDPSLEVGRIGVKSGPITSSCDLIKFKLSMAADAPATSSVGSSALVAALASMVTELQTLIARQSDLQSRMSVVWGQITAVSEPAEGGPIASASGTVRCLDEAAWSEAGELVPRMLSDLAALYRVTVKIEYVRGVPAVVNDDFATRELGEAARIALGPESTVPTTQSLAGEDFAWYLNHVRGSLGRLGVRKAGDLSIMDLHQPTFDVDERAIDVGVRLLTTAALLGYEHSA